MTLVKMTVCNTCKEPTPEFQTINGDCPLCSTWEPINPHRKKK